MCMQAKAKHMALERIQLISLSYGSLLFFRHNELLGDYAALQRHAIPQWIHAVALHGYHDKLQLLVY